MASGRTKKRARKNRGGGRYVKQMTRNMMRKSKKSLRNKQMGGVDPKECSEHDCPQDRCKLVENRTECTDKENPDKVVENPDKLRNLQKNFDFSVLKIDLIKSTESHLEQLRIALQEARTYADFYKAINNFGVNQVDKVKTLLKL